MGLQFLLMDKKRAKELDKLDPNLIESMNVLKGKMPWTNMAKPQMVLLNYYKKKPFEISNKIKTELN
jgi:hypothetical protein